MTTQSQNLLAEWNATAGNMLNADYALRSERCKQVAELFNGQTYSRIHRATNGDLMLEERTKGSMYPSCWLIIQDFSDLEKSLAAKIEYTIMLPVKGRMADMKESIFSHSHAAAKKEAIAKYGKSVIVIEPYNPHWAPINL